MKHEDIKMDKKTVKKAVGMHDKQMHGGKKTDLAGLKKGGDVKKMMMGGMSGKARPSVNQTGGMGRVGSGPSMASMGPQRKPMAKRPAITPPAAPAPATSSAAGVKLAPDEMKKGGKVKKMAKGGSVSSRADGCATKGKTKGRII